MSAATTIKAISLWQPWATAMARRDKAIETRSWPTSHRGWLAIHAAKRRPDNVPRLFGEVPLGAVVCIAWMTDCVRTEKLHVSATEEEWGDYAPGRFGWITDPYCLIDLPTPIALRGHQGLFDWEVPEQIAELLRVREARG